MCFSDDNCEVNSKNKITIENSSVSPSFMQSSSIIDDVNNNKKSGTYHNSCQPNMGLFVSMLMGCTLSLMKTLLSLSLPHILTPKSSKKLYVAAFWYYESSLSIFDNSIWTYGTDYALMIVMLILARYILRKNKDPAAPTIKTGKIDNINSFSRYRLRRRAASLLICYAVSVGTGGLAHQLFRTVESRNTLVFRILWTFCVGTVTAAGGIMGVCGTEMARKFHSINTYQSLSEPFWAAYGGFTTAICIIGHMSFQRPACDIFVAGITQTAPTVYLCALAVSLAKRGKLPRKFQWLFIAGFFLNAPLLPLYSLVQQNTNWSLARINALLHCWLCAAWTSQGLALRYVSDIKSVERREKSTTSLYKLE